MSEEPTRYHTGPAATPELPLTTEDLVARAHAHRQGIPDETGEQRLERLPERVRASSDLARGGKMSAEEIAYAIAVLIDSIENAQVDARPRRRRAEPAR